MEKPNVQEQVIFRKWRAKPQTVIALFPQIEATNTGLCLSYEHVGQHGGADYQGVIQLTRPAKPQEYQELKEELERLGYDLRVCSRR